MGCSSSKDADQPKKTIIIQEPQPIQHIIPIDNGTTSIINEKRRIHLEEEDRARRDALERAEARKREAPIKSPPRFNKDKRHPKVLSLVDDKYKDLQSLLILLYENLRKHSKEDKELSSINLRIKNDAKDIENLLDDLNSQAFPNDKEYNKDLKKILLVAKNLDLEYQGLKKKNTKYSEYKKNVLGLLHDQYADLFDESKTQESIRKSDISMSPRSELQEAHAVNSRSGRVPMSMHETVMFDRGVPLGGQSMVTPAFDDPFDREMANVLQKQRDDAAFELDTAIHEYERLQVDYNVLRTRQDNLQKDFRATQQEIKELQNANRQVQNLNGTIGQENGSFNNTKSEVLRKHEQSKKVCVDLEKELAELRALYVQRVAESDLIEQEHHLKVVQMEYEIKRKQDEARDIDMSRKEEELRQKEEERRCVDDERRREELERRRRDVERKRQDDERKRVEDERIRKEEVRRVEAKVEEVDRQRRNLALEPIIPVVSDFTASVPIIREVRSSVPMIREIRSSVHSSPMRSMPIVLPPMHPDGKEVERRLQEDVRRIQMMNEEADRRRAQMMHQLNAPVVMEVPTVIPTPAQYSTPTRFQNMTLPNKYSSMTLESIEPVVVVEPPKMNFVNHEAVVPIVNGDRRNVYVEHPVEYYHQPVRNMVVEHPKVEVASSALEMARRARMGTDKNQVAAVMDNMRLEAQHVPINYQGGFGF